MDVTTIYPVIPRLLSHPQVMESLNWDLVAIHFWCLKWHMRLNYKKTKLIVVSRSRTYASGYGNLTLGCAELEEVSLRILGVSYDSKLTFEIHLREAVSKAARTLSVVRRTEKLFDCPRELKSYFNAYVLSNLEHASSCGCRHQSPI